MQSTRSNDARSSTIKKESPTLEDTVDAELWLNLMTSMMNFAVASTNLMKAIQDKTGVSVVYKDDMKKPQDTSELTAHPEEVQEVCTSKTCDVLYQTEEGNEPPVLESTKDDEEAAAVTANLPEENALNIPKPQAELQEESPQNQEPQPEESQVEPENKGLTETSEKTMEEHHEEPSEKTDLTGDIPDITEQQPPAEPEPVKEHAKKTCNVANQEKEPYKELCSGNCGAVPQSRIPVPIKKKKHKYSMESQRKLQEAREEQGKPPKRACGCRAEECELKPCSCEDMTTCAPSGVSGVCVCADKTQTTQPLTDVASPSFTVEEPAVEEKAPELLTSTISDQGAVATGEIAVQATEVVSAMCCCDEQLIEEELLASDGDCGCQTESTDSFQDFELATISQHLQQTDDNLEELRKEVQRISDCITGKKRYADDVAAALYHEIMKPRTSIVEVTGPSHRMSPKRRDQVPNPSAEGGDEDIICINAEMFNIIKSTIF